MSESSRSRVTITLGRTGRVFKRAATELDSSYADLHPIVGSKRLENNFDSSAQINNKRLRGDGRSASDDSVKDSHLVKDDLRYKLLEKNKLKQAKDGLKNGLDLRNILSRPAQSSSNSMSTWQRMPGSKDTRLHCIESVEGRKYLAQTRDGRHVLPVTRNFSQHIPEFRAERAPDPRKQRILKAREGGQSFLKAKEIRHQLPEPGNHGMMADVSETRASNAMPRTESGINSYSPWTLDHLRQRLPDESWTTSRGLGAPKMDEVLQRRYAVRTSDDARAGTYMNRDAFDISRPMSSSHLAKMAPPGGQMKTMGPVASPLPLSGNFTKKSSFAMEDQLSIDGFLHSLGLEKYAILFKAEEVDMYSLKRMSESDLKELGVPMGPRKKILLSLPLHLKQEA